MDHGRSLVAAVLLQACVDARPGRATAYEATKFLQGAGAELAGAVLHLPPGVVRRADVTGSGPGSVTHAKRSGLTWRDAGNE